ncbi:Curved DNA-binding protein [Morella rubra]|uniref:Curved DNA-binding protein n=1 Tax=Morella rubra TaxID=262757 RepID=A0A6A1UQ49_9ROSI|nr:Curved DNA-binding protein [Morella rubra]KAB1202286.1 Curved DNA-binding protein [Morella rubra]
MTDDLLDYAKEKFIAGKLKDAFDIASLAKDLDPYFCSVGRCYAAYRIHYVGSKKNRSGHNDPYAILGLKADPSLSVDAITDAFCKLVKLVHPDVLSSPAAKGALRLITSAWEILSDEKSRVAYETRMGLRPRPPKPPTYQRKVAGIKRCAADADGRR